MWDVLLATEGVAKSLAVSILTTNSMRMQTKDMGTRKTKVTLYRVPLYISEDHLRYFFAKFHEVTVVSSIKSKTSIIEIMLTLTRKKFMEILNVLLCGGYSVYVVVES